MNIILVFLFSFFISSCSNNVTFHPETDKLPDAKVGEHYSVEIHANFSSGDMFYFTKKNTEVRLTPSNTGLKVSPDFNIQCARDCGYHNNFVISGIPHNKGDLRIGVYVQTVNTMFTPSEVLSKEYLLTIR